MTIYGIDVSEHNNGLDLHRARAEGMEFVMIRLCDGTYRDQVFGSHLADAEDAGLLTSTYWYLHAPSEGSTIAQQVDVIDRQLGGRKDLGVWIDVESVTPSGVKTLTGDDVHAAKAELERRGYHCPGVYTGRWYWEVMPGGEPAMDGLGYLWVSSYGRNGTGAPRALYAGDGGDGHSGWSYPLGNRLPDVLQFGSQGTVAGFYPVDVNAYRGSLDELQSIFTGGEVPATNSQEDDMTPDQAGKIDAIYNQLAGSFTNGEYPGFDIDELYTRAASRGFGRLTLMEAAAVIVKESLLTGDQLAGTGRDADGHRAFTGWPQLGDRTIADAIGSIADRLTAVEKALGNRAEGR